MNKSLIFTVLCLAALAKSASGRYLLVPLDDIEMYNMPLRQARSAVYSPSFNQYRFRRSPIPDEPKNYISVGGDLESNRRDDLSSEVPASFIVPASLRSEIEPETSATSTYTQKTGPDYVDYGAYTGGYGSFGWYSDHPVLLQGVYRS